MSFVEAVFFLLCCSLSFHACTGRVPRGMDFDHVQGFGSQSVMVSMQSNLLESDAASSLKTISTVITGHRIASGQTVRHRDGRSLLNAGKVKSNTEERILHERNAAAQEYDSNDSNDAVEEVVVMDYAQPHRKPPIHNEEN